MTDYLSVQGKRLEVRWVGEDYGDRPVLVFLHEGLGSMGLWKEFPSALCRAARCRGFVFSRAGYGDSDPCRLPRKINFMHTEALSVLPELLRAARIKRHILMGHSDGGSIGVIYAGSPHATGLCGLVTEAAHLFCEPVTLKAIEAAKKAYLTGGLKAKLARYHGKNTDTAFWGWNSAWLNPKFAGWNIEKYLKKIRVPVLALQGRQDPYGTLEQLYAMDRGASDCRIDILEDCGHCPHREQGRTVLKRITEFIRSLPAS